MEPTAILLLISDLEGSYHHCRINGFDEDKDTIRAICDKYYKLYFKLKRDQKNGMLED